MIAVLALWASFGPSLGLYTLLSKLVPGMSLLRAPARFGVVVIFALAVLAGFGFARLEKRNKWLARTRPGRARRRALGRVADS